MHTATLDDRHLPTPPPTPAVDSWGEADRGPVLARLGRYVTRLARTASEREAVFALRYRVFVAQGGARPDGADHAARREADALDASADHLIVCDTDAEHPDRNVVGTYRARCTGLARGGAAVLFDLAPLLGQERGRLCEVSRSCVAPHARGHRVLEALWGGLWAYARAREIDVLFGAASFPGAEPAPHAEAIAWLAGRDGAPVDLPVKPHPHCAVTGVARPALRDGRAIRRALPPLIRGYLDLGATFSAGAARDPVFDTTDMLVSLRLATIPARYREHFARVCGQTQRP